MAKLPLTNIGSGFGSNDALNANFDAIELEADNNLSRDGSAPNAMEAELDMGGNALINLAAPDDASHAATKSYVDGLLLSNPGSVTSVVESQTSTSGQTTFTLTSLTYTPGANNLDVYINGVHQNPSAYTETSASIVTFGEALEVSDTVLFKANQRTASGDTILAANATFTPAGSGAVDSTAQTKLRERVSVIDFGATGDGVADDTAAIVLAETYCAAENYDLFYPPGTYLVTNWNRQEAVYSYGEGASWKIGAVTVGIPDSIGRTTGAFTVYVSTTGSDSANCGLSSATAFATPQRAYDSLPPLIRHNVRISMADGTYNTSSRAVGTLARHATLYLDNKHLGDRTDNSSGDLVASVEFEGNTADKTAVIIESSATFDESAVYVQQGQVAFDHVTLKSNTAGTTSCLTAHRTDTYVHMVDCVINGNAKQATYGIVAETGSVVEFTGTDGSIDNCTVGGAAIGGGAYFGFSGGCTLTNNTTALLGNQSGTVHVESTVSGSSTWTVIASTNTNGITLTNSVGEVRSGASTNTAHIDAPIACYGSSWNVVLSEIDSTQSMYASSMNMSSSSYQDQIILRASQAYINNTTSYISPATENDDANPISAIDSNFMLAGTSDVAGTGSSNVNSFEPFQSSYTNTETKQYTVAQVSQIRGGGVDVVGTAGDVTSCMISTDNFAQGDTIHVTGTSANSVQFINGTHMELAASIVIGGGSGDYTGAIFQMYGTKWRVVGLGQVRP